MLKFISYVAALIVVSAASFAQTPFRPTTTLTLETANNTSGADQFSGEDNGNRAPGNISKVPIQSVLYPGAMTRVYAHLMPWFGFGDHVDIGYHSADVLQIQKQVADMISRGINGVIVDWYGRGESRHNFAAYDKGVQSLMLEAEKHPGFTFAVMEDAGALKDCGGNGSCDLTQNLIEDLNYANRTYQTSPAYMQYDGRPVVFFFGLNAAAVDWGHVKRSVAGNPLFVFRNSGAFNHAESDGGYSWVHSGDGNNGKGSSRDGSAPAQIDMTYLNEYYNSATHHPDSLTIGSGYKGFDDSIALWSGNRFLNQHCGQTWLQSIADAGNYYSVNSQLFGLQLVTWNDYEEGTEIETGIDNCIKISAETRGTSVRWSVEGDESTIDHYTVFVSQDGENLMPLANAAAGEHSLDLGAFHLDGAEYTVFVKAIGKPSLTNQMSYAVRVRISGDQLLQSAALDAVLTVSPGSADEPQQIMASIAASHPVAAAMLDFGDGTIVSGQLAATHVYLLPGTYAVMASVSDTTGARSTQVVSVTISPPR